VRSKHFLFHKKFSQKFFSNFIFKKPGKKFSRNFCSDYFFFNSGICKNIPEYFFSGNDPVLETTGPCHHCPALETMPEISP